MATGLPVVVTDVGGNPEIVRQEVDGLRVPRGDDAAMAGTLARLLDDPTFSIALGQSARDRVLDRHRLENAVVSYARLYERHGQSPSPGRRPDHTSPLPGSRPSGE